MGQIVHLQCVSCGQTFAPSDIEYTCPACGPRRGTLEVIYNYAQLRANTAREIFAASGRASMWRYLPPVSYTHLRAHET